MNILIIDNYDSFTYNLAHTVKSITQNKVTVFRNDKINIEDIDAFDKIIISPGPGIPNEAGITKELIAKYKKSKSILGICLGMQAICEVFGGQLINTEKVYHGVATHINVHSKNETLFHNIPDTFEAGRYHSWIIDKNQLPEELEITSYDDLGNPMSLRHKTFDVKGVQFHPESILTMHGEAIIRNWINSSAEESISLPYNGNKKFSLNSFSNKLIC